MGKRIYWGFVILISLAGLTAMIYYGMQPRPILTIELSKFESPGILANSLLQRLQPEIKATPVVLLGVEFDKKDHQEVWTHFLDSNSEAGLHFDQVFIDKDLSPDFYPNAKVMNFKDDFQTVLGEIENGLKENKRFALITPTSYSSQVIPNNLAYFLNANLSVKAMSMSLVNFPRSREEEKNSSFPCVVEGVDQSGLGPFGCLLVQLARAQYRKRYSPGEYIGFVNQIGLSDYIVFYTQEK